MLTQSKAARPGDMNSDNEVEEERGQTQFSKSCRQIYDHLAEDKKSSRIRASVNSNGSQLNSAPSSFDGAMSPTPVTSSREMNELRKDAAPHLEWQISESAVRWITASRNMQEECPGMFGSDIVNWKLKVLGMLLYGAAQILISVMAACLYFFDGRETTVIVLLSHTGVVIASFLIVHIVNRFRLLLQASTVTYCSAFLVVLCTVGPPLHFILGASAEPCATLIWNLGGPAGALFLLPRPIQSLWTTMAARIVLDIAALIAGHATDLTEQRHSPLISFLVLVVSHTLCPLALAFMFRRASAENEWRAVALSVSQRELGQKQAVSRRLIHCMVPENHALLLPSAAPSLWHTGPYDVYRDCSILQMDVSGFTALSTSLENATELVELINALFTSIDFAAECIGHVWKVELIGDCYKAIVGGVHPCEDHAYRAAVFAYTIVEIVKRISDRVGVALRVRVGVHSGEVTCGVVGELKPRYLMFGRDTEIVNKLECGADPGQVLMSEDAASRLKQWPHLFKKVLGLCDGTEVRAHAIESPQINQKAMGKARSRFHALARFHKHFCRSQYNLKLMSRDLIKEAELEADGGIEEEGGEEADRIGAGVGVEEGAAAPAPSRMQRAASYRRGSRRGSLSEEIAYVSKVAEGLDNKRLKMAQQRSMGSMRELYGSAKTLQAMGKGSHAALPVGKVLQTGSSERRLRELASTGSERVQVLRVNTATEGGVMFLTDKTPSSSRTEPAARRPGQRWFGAASPGVREEGAAQRPGRSLRKARTEGRLVNRQGIFSFPSERDPDRPFSAATPPLTRSKSHSVETSSPFVRPEALAARSALPQPRHSVGEESFHRRRPGGSISHGPAASAAVAGRSFGLGAAASSEEASADASSEEASADAGHPRRPSELPAAPNASESVNSPTGGAHNPPVPKAGPQSAPAAGGGEVGGGAAGAGVQREEAKARMRRPLKALPPVEKKGGGAGGGKKERGGAGEGKRRTLRELRPLGGVGAGGQQEGGGEQVEGCQENPPAVSARSEAGRGAGAKGGAEEGVSLPGCVEEGPAREEEGPIQPQEPHLGGAEVVPAVKEQGTGQEGPGPDGGGEGGGERGGAAAQGEKAVVGQGKGGRSERSMGGEGGAGRRAAVGEEEVAHRAHRTALRIAEDTRWLTTKKERQRPRRNSVESTTDTTATNLTDAHGTGRGVSWFLPSSADGVPRGRHANAQAAVPEADEELPAISDSWLGAAMPDAGEGGQVEDGSMSEDSEDEGGEEERGGGAGSPLKAKKGSELLKGDEEEEARDDGEAEFRLARVTSYFLLGVTSTAAVQTAVMLYVYFAEPRGRLPQTYDLAPAWLYVVLVASMLMSLLLNVEWSSSRAQLLAGCILMASPVALLGGLEEAEVVQNAVVWSFLAVLLRCSSASLNNHYWLAWLGAYLVVVGAFHSWNLVRADGIAAEELPWWRELLLGVNHVMATSLCLLPLALTASDLLEDEKKAVTYLLEAQQQERLEQLLLTALVPPELSEQFLLGDRVIAVNYTEATALFIYVCDYERVMLEFGAEMTVSWVNRIFTCLDGCIDKFPKHSVCKVETFNNFLLAFSGVLETEDGDGGVSNKGLSQRHAERCTALAVHMLHSAASVERPDGQPTLLKVGLSSGPICAGVICRLGSPRYSIFGDAVNTASRMASNALPCTAAEPYIHLSAATRESMDDDFCAELRRAEGLYAVPRGDGIQIKGKGRMQTYCVTKHREPDDEAWARHATL